MEKRALILRAIVTALALAAGAAAAWSAQGERSSMMEKTAAPLPALDRNVPAVTELATFALG